MHSFKNILDFILNIFLINTIITVSHKHLELIQIVYLLLLKLVI
jgi:hypothetical protein